MNEKYIILKYRKDNYNFEILVYPDKAFEFKEGKIKDIREAIVSDEIYKDARKGERVSSDILKKAFGTDNRLEIIKKIILESDIPLTTEYKRKLLEERKKYVIEGIRRIAIDPRTNAPFTYERLNEMIESIKYRFDLSKSPEKEIEDLIKELRKKYPIKIEIKRYKVIVPLENSKYINILKSKYKLIKEEWGEKWIGIFEVPIGLSSSFYSDAGKICEDIEEIKE